MNAAWSELSYAAELHWLIYIPLMKKLLALRVRSRAVGIGASSADSQRKNGAVRFR
jgi:hypothetical protein